MQKKDKKAREKEIELLSSHSLRLREVLQSVSDADAQTNHFMRSLDEVNALTHEVLIRLS